MKNVLEKVGKIIIKNLKWIIALITMIIFIAIAEDVFENEIFGFDSVIYNFLISKRNVYINSFFKIITNFGGSTSLVLVTIISMIFVKGKKYKIMLPLNLYVSAFLNYSLKNIFERTRPDNMRLIEETGFSFPSGHSMVSMAFYGYLIYLIYKYVKNKYIKWSLIVLLSCLIVGIGTSRIYLGVHYTSDVLGGFLISISYLVIYISAVNKFLTER